MTRNRKPVRGGGGPRARDDDDDKAPRPARETRPAAKRGPVTVREAALLILERVERGGERADDLLAKYLPKFPESHRDRALLTTLVNGTLRHRGRLDWLLGHFVRRDLATLTGKERNNLRLALFQLEYMDRIPARAAIFEAVELSRRYGHEGLARFTNGVLRAAERSRATVPPPDMAGDPAGAIAILESHPRWMVERWIAAWGVEEAQAIARAGNRIPPITLRVNRTLADRDALRVDLEADGLHPEPGAWSRDVLHLRENTLLPALRAYGEGWFAVQDEASALVAPLLGVKRGMTVLDLCAAPGGKSAHLAELVGPEGRVIAVDVSRSALRRVTENMRRLRLPQIMPVEGDGRTIEVAPVDAVLVDAPCSGTGVLARRADSRWRRRPEDIARFHALQVSLLEHAADLVRPGGAILYATCTLEPEENEGVVYEVLARRADLEVEQVPAVTPLVEPGSAPPPVDARGLFRMLPHRHGTDGAFAARLRKRN